MAIVTVSQARANLHRLIDQVVKSHEPIHIDGRGRAAVLVSAEDWDAIQETMYLLSVPDLRKSIREAAAEPVGKSAKELRW